MGIVIDTVHFDTGACSHPAPAALLRIMGECLFCGHCGADVPSVIRNAVIRCDGSAVHITQVDFGDLHVCGEHDEVDAELIRLLDLSAASST